MRPSLIISDFDGVIADSTEVYAEAYRRTFRHYGFEVPFIRFQSWYDSRWEENWLNSGFCEEELPDVIRTFSSFISYESVEPYPGAETVLKALRLSAPLVIASTTPADLIEEFLRQKALRGYFEGFYTPSGTGSDKKQLFNAALMDSGATPSCAVVVGDTPSDIRPARQLGCRSVGVTYGWYDGARLIPENPSVLVDNINDIPTALVRLDSVRQ